MTSPARLALCLLLSACGNSPLSLGNDMDAASVDVPLDAAQPAREAGARRDASPDDDRLIAEIKARGGLQVAAVTIACGADCVEVKAIAKGGNPPYAFKWGDGVETDSRQICAKQDANYAVAVSDTGYGTGEFAYVAQTATASVMAQLLGCADGGACTLGPALGDYRGTYELGGALTGGELTISITRSEAGALEAQVVQALIVIPGQTTATGSFDCLSSRFAISGIQDFGEQAWLWAGSYDAAKRQLKGEMVQHLTHAPPLPVVGERPSDGSGTWSTFTVTLAQP